MSLYRDRTTGNLTTLSQAIAAHPSVAFGTPMTANDFTTLNIDPVLESPLPACDGIVHVPQEVQPTKGTDGNWYRTYVVVDISTGLTGEELTTCKQGIYNVIAPTFDAKRDAIIDGGFKFDFSNFDLGDGTNDTGVKASTITVNGTAGILTLQMGTDDQVNWLGQVAQAQLALAAAAAASTTAANMQLRTKENLWIVATPAQVIAILSAAGTWKSAQITTAGKLKDQLTAIINDANGTADSMLAVVWPAS